MSELNTIKLYSDGKTYTFGDRDYVQGSVQDVLANSLIGVDLSIDELSFVIRSRIDGPDEWLYDEDDDQLFDIVDDPLTAGLLQYYGVDFSSAVPYKDIVELYHDNTLEGKFYVQSVKRIGRDGGWNFVCVSAMGIIDRQEHGGGIYFADSAGDLISEIMGSLPYSIDADVAATPIYGWLPYSTGRDNLRQLLFALGASLIKDANGDPYFTYTLSSTMITKKVKDVYVGSSRDEIAPATSVSVTEHSFYASSAVDPVVVYEADPGVYASGYKIIFDQPYHTLVGSGVTIDDSGANWAIISGSGSVTGIPYVHVQRTRNKSTGASGEPSEISVTDATLIGPINSVTALDRLAAYYSQTEEVAADVLTDARPGVRLRIPDPNDFSTTVSGYIKTAARQYSSTVKNTLKLTRGWTPSHIGNAFDAYMIVEKSDLSGGSWTVPNALRGKAARVVLFGGAYGGQGGYDGESGQYSQYVNPDQTLGPRKSTIGGEGGAGGDPGSGGGPGKFLQVDIASLANSYTASIGTGGTGGTHNGGFGSIGGDTTFGSYSTASGVVPDGPYVNIIDGALYGEPGDDGTAGKAGGKAGDWISYAASQGGQLPGTPGQDYSTTWKGGLGGVCIDYDGTYSIRRASGGGGGGAAYGSSGGNGGQDPDASTIQHPGAGANAVAPAKADFYRGGDGGHGGGGGGGGGYSYTNSGTYLSYDFDPGAAGGLGSSGGQGADGFILVYYKA